MCKERGSRGGGGERGWLSTVTYLVILEGERYRERLLHISLSWRERDKERDCYISRYLGGREIKRETVTYLVILEGER